MILETSLETSNKTPMRKMEPGTRVENVERLFESNPLPMWVYDRETLQFLAVNLAACQHYGYTREEFLGLTAKDIRPEEDVSRLLEFLANPAPRFDTPRVWRHRRKDGSIMSVEIVGQETEFEGRRARLVVAIDATERLRAEERFRLVAKVTSDVIWDWDVENKTLWSSDGIHPRVTDSFGGTLLGIESWTERIHPTDRPAILASVDRALASAEIFWSGSYRRRRPDGTYADVEDRGYILRDASRKAVRMIGGMTDVTEPKQLEAQYLRAQRMESLGALAGGIAHDLNNMLAPVMMAVELIRPECRSAQAVKMLEILATNVQRGADLVQQVLLFSRSADGSHVPVGLGKVVHNLVQIAQSTFPPAIEVQGTCAEDLWFVSADPTQLHQVLLNLAVNARDAMPHGGVLTVTAENVTLNETFDATDGAVRVGPHVLITISDTGEGIPREIQQRIFEPFFTTKGEGKGTGLGLSTVSTIVKNHHGIITLDSEPGRGTAFRIHLPAQPELRAVSDGPAPVLPRGRGEFVLVVDDESSIRAITQQTLETFGYRVATAADGAAAITLFAKRRSEIAIVIIDMVMPIIDGVATIAALRRLNPDVRLIAVSGLNADPAHSAHDSIPANLCLTKPHTAEKLLVALRQALD